MAPVNINFKNVKVKLMTHLKFVAFEIMEQ